jgi:hypothetical protein
MPLAQLRLLVAPATKEVIKSRSQGDRDRRKEEVRVQHTNYANLPALEKLLRQAVETDKVSALTHYTKLCEDTDSFAVRRRQCSSDLGDEVTKTRCHPCEGGGVAEMHHTRPTRASQSRPVHGSLFPHQRPSRSYKDYRTSRSLRIHQSPRDDQPGRAHSRAREHKCVS